MTFHQRGKQWFANAFFVEWMDNTVEACTKSPGKEGFEMWMTKKWGPQQAREIMEECSIRVPAHCVRLPRRDLAKSTTDKDHYLWEACGAYYGITPTAAQYFHEYASGSDSFHPPQRKPPVKRRKGESSGQWLARLREKVRVRVALPAKLTLTQLLSGHKLPIIDFERARRTAISEYDKIRDKLERWRTDPEFFFSELIESSHSTVLVPQEIPQGMKLDKNEQMLQRIRIRAAFRENISFFSLMYSAWKGAAELLEYLASQGLHTVPAVERAYQKDQKLLWRFVSVTNRVYTIQRRMCRHMQDLLATNGYYKTWYHAEIDETGTNRFVENPGVIQGIVDRGEYTGLDQIISTFVEDKAPAAFNLIGNMDHFFRESPEEEHKFSAEVFDALGDLAAVTEFSRQFTATEFGNRLAKYANDLQEIGRPETMSNMRSIVYYMNPDKLKRAERRSWDHAGQASSSIREMDDAWRRVIWDVNLARLVTLAEQAGGCGGQKNEIPLEEFNAMWFMLDWWLYVGSASLARDEEKARVAEVYGIFSPAGPNRPLASPQLLGNLEPDSTPEPPTPPGALPSASPAPFVSPLAVARPAETVVQSGHAYVGKQVSAKEKIKTRKEPKGGKKVVEVVEESDSSEDESEEEPVPLPEFLPREFKLGKKVLKLFHRILEPSEDPDKKDNSASPTKGQVRWGDFEHAMRRIGFEIEQTAGSSVRFDPPAVSARPITFHRPHPDAILTPLMIKWCVVRSVGSSVARTLADWE
uniref:Uncharacterized protein n=1 Tax=Mycena chlorophos TaxID=658473 RepID=A0ABQ0LJS7_MYCCL|nr:predicted protein [Mycena chlorophos]